MIVGLIPAIINIICICVVIYMLKRSAKHVIMHKKLYDHTYNIENEMKSELNNTELPENISIQELEEAIIDHADMLRSKHMNNIKEYMKYSIINILLILFNSILLIFNIVHYQLWKFLVLLILKIYLKILGG